MNTVIVVAASGADAGQWQENHLVGFQGRVVVVTPRSLHAARGFTAVALLCTDAARQEPRFADMVADALPAVGAPIMRSI